MKKRIVAIVSAAVMTATSVSAAFDKTGYENKYSELMSLIEECERRGIDVGAERVNAATIKKFIPSIVYDEELAAGLTSEGYDMTSLNGRSVSQSTSELDSLYTEAKEKLEAYLDGSENSQSVSLEYKTGELSLDDSGLNIDGEPYYAVGYGHFNTVINDIPMLNDVGADNIQMEIGPNSVLEIVNKDSKTYTYEGNARDNAAKRINNVLKDAEENNVGVNLLLSPHYMPDWCMQWYPEMEGASFGWCKYNIFSDKAKQLVSEYLKGILPKISDSKALVSVVLTNEPECVTYKFPKLFTSDYQKYLLSKYRRSIASLNEKWGTSYTSFSDISMPEYDSSTGLPTKYDANFYEWYIYNENKFTDWHKWMANEVRKYLPNVKISIKVLDYFWYNDKSAELRMRGISGNDVEKLAEFCDFAGCDAYGCVDADYEIFNKYKWYDYLRSVTGQPIYNSENHIFYDGYTNMAYSQNAAHAMADVWLGAIHGCEMTDYWTWERLDYRKGNDATTWKGAVDRELSTPYAASLLHRPSVVAGIGKQVMNLRRLNDEVRALEKAENKLAILYSKAARVYSLDYMGYMQTAYREIASSGFGVDFVTENNPERMNKYETLVLTGVNNITEDTLTCIYEFIKNGGKVILADSTLERNEYNLPSDSEKLSYIKANAVGASCSALKEVLYQNSTESIKLELKKSNGEYVDGVDFKWVQNNDGSILANICNLTENTMKKLTLYKNGVPVAGKDLINGANISEKGITADKYSPILVYIPGNGGTVKNISADKDNNIKWQRELFPIYVSEISDGIENKSFYALANDRIDAEAGRIYYLQRTEQNKMYPGTVFSLQSGKRFETVKNETGYTIKNLCDTYSAGVLVFEYKSGAKALQNIYLAPNEEKSIDIPTAENVRIYNNLSQRTLLN